MFFQFISPYRSGPFTFHPGNHPRWVKSIHPAQRYACGKFSKEVRKNGTSKEIQAAARLDLLHHADGHRRHEHHLPRRPVHRPALQQRRADGHHADRDLRRCAVLCCPRSRQDQRPRRPALRITGVCSGLGHWLLHLRDGRRTLGALPITPHRRDHRWKYLHRHGLSRRCFQTRRTTEEFRIDRHGIWSGLRDRACAGRTVGAGEP